MIKLAIARSRKTFIQLCESERLNRSKVVQVKNHTISGSLFVNKGITSLYKADVSVYFNSNDNCRKAKKILDALKEYLDKWQCNVRWVDVDY